MFASTRFRHFVVSLSIERKQTEVGECKNIYLDA